nr:MAG TPA: Dolichol-phosphate mannosyltransferase subunit [Crassvirales sp.]
MWITLVTFKEFGELHKALKEQIQTAKKSNNPWIKILMKSMNIGSSIDEIITDELIDNMIDSMLGKE